MTDQQKRFFELVTEYENLKQQMKKFKTELNLVMEKLGTETYHQDPATMLVYKIEVPKGTFIDFPTIGYKRTAKPGEKGGTVLSKKEAQEQGFEVLGGKSE